MTKKAEQKELMEVYENLITCKNYWERYRLSDFQPSRTEEQLKNALDQQIYILKHAINKYISVLERNNAELDRISRVGVTCSHIAISHCPDSILCTYMAKEKTVLPNCPHWGIIEMCPVKRLEDKSAAITCPFGSRKKEEVFCGLGQTPETSLFSLCHCNGQEDLCELRGAF